MWTIDPPGPQWKVLKDMYLEYHKEKEERAAILKDMTANNFSKVEEKKNP